MGYYQHLQSSSNQAIGGKRHMQTEAKDADLAALLLKINECLVPLWPDAKPLLHYGTCFELLCSVILSAQCTDEQVNAVTPFLFKKYPSAEEMAQAKVEDVENIIHSVGFFHTKSKNLVATAQKISLAYGGSVPSTMGELLSLPGVGRKTANLVLSACFGTPGIIVDTHVMRVACRLGISRKKDPALIEALIRQNLEPDKYTAFSHALNRHGKYVCTARKPACRLDGGSCPLEEFCPQLGLDSRS